MKDRDDPGIEVRCFCEQRPLLARCGRDPHTGEPWVHLKVYKAKRLYAEMIASSGMVKVRCRECRRWHTVKIILGAPRLQEDMELGKSDI